jgi:hypothetical protein
MMLPSSAHAEMTALSKLDTNCTTLSLIPTVTGNTVRSFSAHGHLSAAQGSSTTVSRSDIGLIQHLASSAHGLYTRMRCAGEAHIHHYACWGAGEGVACTAVAFPHFLPESTT